MTGGDLIDQLRNKELAGRELGGLAAGLPTRVISAAKERGRSWDWRLAAEETAGLMEKLAVDSPETQAQMIRDWRDRSAG